MMNVMKSGVNTRPTGSENLRQSGVGGAAQTDGFLVTYCPSKNNDEESQRVGERTHVWR